MASLKRLVRKLYSIVRKIFGRAANWLRWLVLALVILFAVLWVACFAADRWLAGENGMNLITAMIRNETGAEVHLGKIDARLPNHVALHDLALRLPIKPGTYEDKPSIKVREIQYHLHLGKLFFGQFEIESITIDGLEISGERRDQKLWIDGMLAYMAEKSKERVEEKKPTSEEPAEPMTLDRLRGLMAKVIIPFRIVIGEIGLKNATIRFKDIQKNRLVTDFHMGPFHALFGGNMWLGKSNFWVDIAGDEKDYTMAARLKQAKLPAFENNVRAHIRLEVDNLAALRLQTSIQGTPVPLESNVSLALVDNYEELQILALDVKAGEIISQRAQGKIRFIDQALKKFQIHFMDELAVDLAKVNTFIPAALDVKVGGVVDLKKLSVDGVLDLNSFEDLAHLKVPDVDLDLQLKDISADVKKASLGHLGGQVALLVKAHAPSDGGIDITNHVDLKIASINVANPSPQGVLKALVANLALKTNAKIGHATAMDEMAIEELQIALTAEKIQATLPGKPSISVPLNVMITGSGQIAKESGKAEIKADLGPLLTTQINAECSTKCNKTTVDLKTVIAKLEDVFELVRPLLPQTAPLPEIKKGRIDVAVHADVLLPPEPQKDWAKRFKAARPVVNSKVTLKQLGVSLPSQKLVVDGIDFGLETKGDLTKQNIATNLSVESVSTPKIPEPLRKTTFELLASAEKDGVIAIDKMVFAAPSVGAVVKLSAKTELDAEKMPENLEMNMSIDVDPHALKAVPKAIALDGRSLVKIAVAAPDLSQVQIRGNVGFEHFGAEVKKLGENGEPDEILVKVINLQGQFPFQQLVNVKQIMDDSKKKAAALAAPSPTPAAELVDKLDKKLDQYLEKYSTPAGASGSRMTSEYYGEMRPLYSGRKPITIESIQVKNLTFDHVEIDAELKQNQFSLNQMVIGMLGGKVQTGLQAQFDTKLRDVNISTQWTRLDTRKLADSFPKLQEKMRGFSILPSSPYVDGTLRLKYDAVSGDIAGGMEITSIGKEQLKMILLYLDPEDKNPTLVSIRKALNIGEVRQVSVPIRNGQIGVDVDVRVLSAPIPTPKLQRFPLAQLVRNFTGANAAKTEKPSDAEVSPPPSKMIDGVDKAPEKDKTKSNEKPKEKGQTKA